ncbi:hypothetical protein [Asticcacaulis sp. YBE204]|nr:hypothetical protein [Asticcacaulis sp. YBE204]ESQ79850.1 hypothetical protein AEYBE204_08370 [Asticcacaulis sp. YBE204]
MPVAPSASLQNEMEYIEVYQSILRSLDEAERGEVHSASVLDEIIAEYQ